MSTSQLVSWIVLPNGAMTADPSKLRLSLFVAPRLRTDEATTLAPFPDFLDWPARLRDGGTSFALEVGNGPTVGATVVGDLADSALWKAFFPATTPLSPFTFDDYADRPFVTWSVRDVLGTLRGIYATAAAAAPDKLPFVVGREHVEPRVPGLVDLFRDLASLSRGRLHEGIKSAEELDGRIRSLLDAARAASAEGRAVPASRGGPLLEPLPADGTASRHFERALLFHRRPRERVALPADAAQHFKASVDFHQMIAALGDHPAILRRLGLIVDVVVAATEVPLASAAAPLTLRARVTWPSLLAPGASTNRTPWTACVHASLGGKTFFCAAERNPSTADGEAPAAGLVPLPRAFTIEAVDVDGAALKTVDFVATLQRLANRPQESFGVPDTAGLPALRTGGLALVQAGRAAEVQGALGDALHFDGALEADGPLTLYAEHVRRGYRLDVWDSQTSQWYSLHRRVVRYQGAALPAPIPEAHDEGFLELSLAGPAVPPGATPDPNAELYLHESLVTWDGWSLSAPRPGKSLSRDPRAPTPEDPETLPKRIANEPLTALGLQIEAAAEPGSLPRLRFGHAYRLRLRSVDLAGNGPTLEEADRRLGSPSAAPLAIPDPEPAVYRRFEPVSAPTLVPRARFEEGASLLRLVVRSNAGVSTEEYAAAFNASALVTAGKHRGYQPVDERHVAPPKAALQQVELHGLFDDAVGSDGHPPDAPRRAAIRAGYELARRESGSLDEPWPMTEAVELSDDPAHVGRYVIHGEEQLEIPYLPDPLAAGAVFFGLPGQAPEEPLVIEFERSNWHDPKPFRLRLAAGSAPPHWDAARRVLTVLLSQASVVTCRVSSLFRGDLREIAILEWCARALSPGELDRVVAAVKRSASWLVTPWHELQLVHAVQQPLAEPRIERFELSRAPGATFAEIFGEVRLDAQSTDGIELVARWRETADDLRRSGPEPLTGEAVVFELPLRTAAQGDTNADPHEIPYSLRGGRLVSFFTARARERGLATPASHAFGDTKHRHVTYRVTATTPFRDYFPAEWGTSRELLGLTSAVSEVDVPSSAPPPAPRALYVVPTLGWETRQEGANVVRRRRGGGLRLYLARPWFASGDGERLGIVVGSNVLSPLAPEYPYVSLVGQDPIRASEGLEFLTAASFRNPMAVTQSKLLETGAPVQIVAFDPIYDVETSRWFCDIDIDTRDAYFPIVRLALVRHQPKSLAGCELSPVVVADIVQTLPDRTLTVTRSVTAPEVLDFTLTGPSYTAVRGPAGIRDDAAVLGRVVARIEQRDASIADGLLGWRAVPGAEVELAPTQPAPLTTWRGQLAVAGTGKRRVIIVEEDRLFADEQTAGAITSRVVYADVLEI